MVNFLLKYNPTLAMWEVVVTNNLLLVFVPLFWVVSHSNVEAEYCAMAAHYVTKQSLSDSAFQTYQSRDK